MASEYSSKRLLSRIISLSDEVEYYTKVMLIAPKGGTRMGAIHRFELVDELTPSKRSHWGKTQFIINVKWANATVASKKGPRFLVRSGAGWLDGDEYFTSLAKEQRPWWQEWTERYWSRKRKKQWRKTARIDFLRLPAEIRNMIYSMMIPVRDFRPYRYTNFPPLRTGWMFTAPSLRGSAHKLTQVNRQICNESTYFLYRLGKFWFSDLQSLTDFNGRVSATNLALIMTLKLRLDPEDVLNAFRANFSAAYLESRCFDLERVMGGWNLEHLIIEFPYGFQLRPPFAPSLCNQTWCKWIVKAVMEYCSVHTVANRVDFVGGPGFLPEEKLELAEVKRSYMDFSYADLDPVHAGSVSYPWTPRCFCVVPCRDREFMESSDRNVYSNPRKVWVVEDL